MRNTFGVLFLLAIISFSCSNKQKKASSLFDVDSLIQAQVQYLAMEHAGLSKTSSLGDSSSSISLTPKDTTAWKKELEIFSVLQLVNKPINRNSYVVESHPDTRSNLSVTTFAIKPSLPDDEKDLPIEYLKIYYLESPDKIRRIEGQYRESSMMYKTLQVLAMEFQPVNDKMILTSYSITGGQKMFMGDSVQYNINTTITLSK
jgi:hypothetical protein